MDVHSTSSTCREEGAPAGYKQTEVGVIPEDWEVKPLAGLAAILHGFGFQSEHFITFGKYRLTTPGHFHEAGGFRDVGDKQKFYDGPLPDGYLLREGDLIVAMTEQAAGLLGSAALVPSSGSYLHNQRLGKLRILSPDLSTRFLYRIFNSSLYRAKVRETAAGTKVKHTSPTKLLEITVPLPPTKAEQEAIAEALSDVDKLLGSLEKLIAKKRAIKQAAMQQLLTGKTRLSGFGGEWVATTLQEIADLRPGINKPASKMGKGTLYVTVQDIYDGTSIKPQKLGRIRVSQAESDFFSLKAGDIIFGKSSVKRDGIGYPSQFLGCGEPVIFSGFTYRARANAETASATFIFYWLRSAPIRKWIIGNSQTSALTNINKSIADAIPIQLPCLSEQQAIATILSDMDAEIAALEQRRDKTRAIKQGMMQQLLTGRVRLVRPEPDGKS